jgi:hypothetical protein
METDLMVSSEKVIAHAVNAVLVTAKDRVANVVPAMAKDRAASVVRVMASDLVTVKAVVADLVMDVPVAVHRKVEVVSE